jgi:hypothetical protein
MADALAIDESPVEAESTDPECPGPSQGGNRECLAEEGRTRLDTLIGQRPDHLGGPTPCLRGQSGSTGREHRVVQIVLPWSLGLRDASFRASFYVYRSTYTVLRDGFKHFRAQNLQFPSASCKFRATPSMIAQFDGNVGLC